MQFLNTAPLVHHEPGEILSDDQIEAAHAATEVGHRDEPLAPARGFIRAVIGGVAVWLVLAVCALVMLP